MNPRLVGIVVAMGALIAAPAFAHHSFGAVRGERGDVPAD